MGAVVTGFQIVLMIDNEVVATVWKRFEVGYHGQFGGDWQGHRIEGKVQMTAGIPTGGGGPAPCGGNLQEILPDGSTTVTICT